MKILILGSGVVGVTTAYFCALKGHEVVVVDRRAAPGMETSFANAGQVSPGYSAPWAGPGVPFKALKRLAMRHRPFVVQPVFEGRLAWWLAQMLANCNEEAYQRNKTRMVRLAEYSRDVLRAVRTDTGISYDHREGGTMQLFRSEKEMAGVDKDMDVLRRSGVPHELLGPDGCVAAEPALALVRNKFVGALRLPTDETGDAHQFTQKLAGIAEGLGAHFRFGVSIRRLITEDGLVIGVDTDAGMLTADRYVLALGSYSAALLRPLGIRLPVYPVKGYSITIPIANREAAPVSTVMDERYKIAITRLGDRIRVGGTAELAAFSTRLRQPRRATLEHSVGDLFPKGGDVGQASFWTGLRPMTPDGTPVIGATAYANLFTNTGHGTLGFTMACGSGKIVADLIDKVEPDISYEDLSITRYAA